ncbi:MAG TPA: hypothetical protein VKK79_08420, partial [Candidatus Lokiarchaeia archaeon]|nr:hypothetical protein [Candidatus Lokiarchaeia archaeon]
MEPSKENQQSNPRLQLRSSLLLRFINETVDQIQKNKRLPEVGRDKLVTNVLLRYLEKTGLQREQGEECGNNQRSAGGAIPNLEQLPMSMP